MDLTSPTVRRALALALGGAGILIAWFTLEPVGLLVSVTATCIWLGWRAGVVAIAVAGLFWAAIVFTRPEIELHNAIRLAIFIAAAGGIWVLVQAFRAVSLSDILDQNSKELVVNIPGHGWSAYPDGRLRYINPDVLTFVGVTADELRTMLETEPNPLERWTHPDDRARNQANWERALKTGEPLTDESRTLRHDGSWRVLRDTMVPTRDKRGRITAWYSHSADVTDQKMAEAALRQRERELQLLVDTVPIHIWLLTAEGEPLYANRRFLNWLGMDTEDTDRTGTSRLGGIETYVHPDDAAEMQEHLARSLALGATFDSRYRLRRFDGAYRWVQAYMEPLRDDSGKILRWYGVNIDVDEEVRAQDELRVVADASGLGWAAYPDGRLRYINPAVLSFIGVSEDELRKMMETDPNPLERWTHPDDRERTRDNWERAISAGETLTDEQRTRRYDGEYRWLRDTIVPSRDKRGQVTGWYGHTQDITEQKRAEEALRQSERELRLLIDTVPTMIFLMTTGGLPYYFNRRFADWAGTQAGDPSGTQHELDFSHTDLIHPDDRGEVTAAFQRSFAKGEPLQYKSRLRRKDGAFRWLDSRLEPLRDENGSIVRWYGVNIDIDDEVRGQEALRLADERLSRASRAASLSELSVSIAHELNSPLQAVVANANAFQRWLNADPPNYERAGRTAERIIRDANAAAEVINRIRALFAQTTEGRTSMDVNGLITEVCELVGDRLLSNTVRLELALDPSLPAVTADRVQVEQVVLNLVRNGIEAMGDVAPGSRLLRIVSRRRHDDMLEVEVEDRGRGIADPERIFDAFYTTKQDGMGMGLAICKSIIEAHEGRISARSTLGQGSSIGFTLPIHAA